MFRFLQYLLLSESFVSCYCTGVAALLYGRCSITASALQYHCNPGCSGWIASDGLNMKDRSSVGGQRKGDFIPVGDLLNLFYEFVRVYIRIGNYIPVYTSLPITITNNHKLYKYYICWVKSSLGIWIEKPGGCSSRWESPFMFTLARCRSSVSFNDGYTTIALCTWVRMHRYDLFPLFCFSHNF